MGPNVLLNFLACVLVSAAEGKVQHDFDHEGVCRRCGARRGDPSLLDIAADLRRERDAQQKEKN